MFVEHGSRERPGFASLPDGGSVLLGLEEALCVQTRNLVV